jgi:hypothetical protein
MPFETTSRAPTRKLALLPLLALLAPLLAACGGDTMERIHRAQYPQDFHYITKREIRTTMAKLAVQIVALDDLLGQPGGPAADQREEVLTILREMRRLAAQLKQAGTTSNHPLIDRDAPRLHADIDRAIAEVQMSKPPSYYAAGRVVGACTYCHQARPGIPEAPKEPRL